MDLQIAIWPLLVVGILALIGFKALLHARPRNFHNAGLSIAAVAAVVVLIFFARDHRSAERAQVFMIEHAMQADQAAHSAHRGFVQVNGVDVAPLPTESLEALWNQLHQVRIDLSDEPTGDAPQQPQPPQQPERPAWVDRPAKRVGNVYQQKLKAGPWQDVADCHRELEAKLRVAVAQRIEQLAGKIARKRQVEVPPLEALGMGIDYVIRELCTEEFVETFTSDSFEEMKNVHVLMEFTEAEDARLVERWQDYFRRRRLTAVTAGAVFVLGGMALIYGLLSLDTWTRGYYTKRLWLGVPAAIIGIIVLLLQ